MMFQYYFSQIIHIIKLLNKDVIPKQLGYIKQVIFLKKPIRIAKI
jgi:hypothetical protein